MALRSDWHSYYQRRSSRRAPIGILMTCVDDERCRWSSISSILLLPIGSRGPCVRNPLRHNISCHPTPCFIKSFVPAIFPWLCLGAGRGFPSCRVYLLAAVRFPGSGSFPCLSPPEIHLLRGCSPKVSGLTPSRREREYWQYYYKPPCL